MCNTLNGDADGCVTTASPSPSSKEAPLAVIDLCGDSDSDDNADEESKPIVLDLMQ